VGESSGSTPDHPPLYAFNVALPAWRERIERDVGIPSLLQGLISDYELQFYLGEAGTGAPIHFHGHAVNSLAHGEKVRLDLSQYNIGCTVVLCVLCGYHLVMMVLVAVVYVPTRQGILQHHHLLGVRYL
jgi:hypothetical protein